MRKVPALPLSVMQNAVTARTDTAENIYSPGSLDVSEGHFGIRVTVLIHREGQARQLGENLGC